VGAGVLGVGDAVAVLVGTAVVGGAVGIADARDVAAGVVLVLDAVAVVVGVDAAVVVLEPVHVLGLIGTAVGVALHAVLVGIEVGAAVLLGVAGASSLDVGAGILDVEDAVTVVVRI